MNKDGIIKSLIDTDLYKLTQQQAVIELFPRAVVKYRFFNRGNTKFPYHFKMKKLNFYKKVVIF